MRIFLTFFIMTLALLASEASQAVQPAAYQVSATLSHAGQPFAAPRVSVQEGKPARIEVAGAEGYTFTVTVTDLAPDRIKVAATLDSSHGAMAPTVVVRPGEPASVAVDGIELTLTVQRHGG
jgi:hypothetical protein